MRYFFNKLYLVTNQTQTMVLPRTYFRQIQLIINVDNVDMMRDFDKITLIT